MAKYGQFDHTQPEPQQIIAWYDTDAVKYPALPAAPDLLTLSAFQWQEHLSDPGGWAQQGGNMVAWTPPPPPPPTVQQQALIALGSPVAVASTAVPDLNAQYPIDQTTQAQITGIASAISAGLGLPGGGATFNWPDITGTPHQWPAEQFIAFAGAIMNYVYGLAQVAQGHDDTLPSSTIVIP